MPEGRYTINILPDKSFTDLVSDIRTEIAGSVTIPSLPPHVTLREDFLSEDIAGFIEKLTGLISEFSPFEISFSHIEIFQRGHVVYLAHKNKELQNLHELTVKTSQKYVSTPREIEFDCELDERQKELIKLYQLPFYFEYYAPHMTIVRLNEQSDREWVLDHIRSKNLPESFKATAVCVYDKLKRDVHAMIPL